MTSLKGHDPNLMAKLIFSGHFSTREGAATIEQVGQNVNIMLHILGLLPSGYLVVDLRIMVLVIESFNLRLKAGVGFAVS